MPGPGGRITIDIVESNVATDQPSVAFLLRRLADDIDKGKAAFQAYSEWSGPIWPIEPSKATGPQERLANYKWQLRPKWWWNVL